MNKVLSKEDLEASIYQDLSKKNSYLFQVSTIESFECSNSFIISNSKFENNQLSIVIEGLFVSDVCEDSSKILNTIHQFDMPPNNHCTFSVNVQDLYKVEGSIFKDVETSQLQVAASESGTPRIQFVNYTINQIKDDYLWIGLDLDNNDLPHGLYTKIMSSLEPYISNKKDIEDGNYGYFEVEGRTTKVFKKMSSDVFNKSFVFRLKEAINSAEHPIIQVIHELFGQNPELSNNEYRVMAGTGVEII